ncbi:DUF6702 family protein [Aequorivita echinoideorum]|uniref:Peptidase E n=1 Tax=Aequorivita echinoideorum TaxID=1549647 RepID=A0ABS5S7E1_9FLAO|nr:DUF6702 family protein [Aequorivita echinoideorum]MBT0609112.1 hypothetical protein [Aequorivita echinoideorum]
MKFLKFLLLAFITIPLISARPAHKFYVSVTKMEYVEKKNSLQIITNIFIDDIENALKARYNKSISLDTKKETETDTELLKQYILQKLKIKVDGKNVELHYIGREYDTDMVVAYIEITKLKPFKNIEIENKVLMEMFPEQQNIIHLKTSESRKSLILDKNEPSGILFPFD